MNDFSVINIVASFSIYAAKTFEFKQEMLCEYFTAAVTLTLSYKASESFCHKFLSILNQCKVSNFCIIVHIASF